MITDHEKRVVAWHEAGHALVSELLPTVDKVQKVSIVPRGKALGYTLNLPQEDRYLKSREELIDYMKVLLAGRVSEQITFGRITTGASDDLKPGDRRSPARWSTSTAMGTSIRSHQVPGRRLQRLRGAAPDARRGGPGDHRGGLPRRRRLLVDHRDLLDEIAERLLTNEVIEHDEIREIMDGGRISGERTADRAEVEHELPAAGDRAAALVTKPPEPEQR